MNGSRPYRTSLLVILAAALLGPGIGMTKTVAPPLVRLAELEIDPAQISAYRRFLTEEIEASVKTEPGVLSLNAVAVKGKPGRVRIMEVYADQAAYEAHVRSPHFLKYKAATSGMVRSLVLLEADPILLLSKTGHGDGNR